MVYLNLKWMFTDTPIYFFPSKEINISMNFNLSKDSVETKIHV